MIRVTNAFNIYDKLLTTKPLTTKCVSAFFIFGLGDYLCQEMENRILKVGKKIDKIRILKQASFGVVVAPYLHLQFCIIIPKLFNESSKYFAVKSTLYAVTISDSLFNFSFFSYMAYLHNKNHREKNEKKTNMSDVMQKFIPVQIMNMKVWPFLSGFIFYFVPCSYRVLFDNFACIFWNIYLSYVENQDKRENNN
jgi:hypothetical protein